MPARHGPGEWVGRLVAEAASDEVRAHEPKTGVQIKIRNQTIIAVQVNVPGARRAAFGSAR